MVRNNHDKFIVCEAPVSDHSNQIRNNQIIKILPPKKGTKKLAALCTVCRQEHWMLSSFIIVLLRNLAANHRKYQVKTLGGHSEYSQDSRTCSHMLLDPGRFIWTGKALHSSIAHTNGCKLMLFEPCRNQIQHHQNNPSHEIIIIIFIESSSCSSSSSFSASSLSPSQVLRSQATTGLREKTSTSSNSVCGPNLHIITKLASGLQGRPPSSSPASQTWPVKVSSTFRQTRTVWFRTLFSLFEDGLFFG